jgi:hypothetical protein
MLMPPAQGKKAGFGRRILFALGKAMPYIKYAFSMYSDYWVCGLQKAIIAIIYVFQLFPRHLSLGNPCRVSYTRNPRVFTKYVRSMRKQGYCSANATFALQVLQSSISSIHRFRKLHCEFASVSVSMRLALRCTTTNRFLGM